MIQRLDSQPGAGIFYQNCTEWEKLTWKLKHLSRGGVTAGRRAAAYLMCVAGKDSSWRDRKSSLCLSWCFCFSGRSAISGFSISSSSSPGREKKKKGQKVKHTRIWWGGTMASTGRTSEEEDEGGEGCIGCSQKKSQVHTTRRYKARGCTLDEPEQWSLRGGDSCVHTYSALHKISLAVSPWDRTGQRFSAFLPSYQSFTLLLVPSGFSIILMCFKCGF